MSSSTTNASPLGEEEKPLRGDATYPRHDNSAWFVGVGIVDAADKEEDGQIVWRGTYTNTGDSRFGHTTQKLQELQELGVLKEAIAESLEAFEALRLKYGMKSEDKAEVLEAFGQFLESRAPLSLLKVSKNSYGKGSNVFRIGPDDYKNLQHSRIPDDIAERTVPPYFWQLRPSEPSSRTAKSRDTKYLDVAFEIHESKAGQITVQVHPVMPWTPKEIEDVPDWVSSMFAEKLSGRAAEHRHRLDQAAEAGGRAFSGFETRVLSATTSLLEKGLLEGRVITNPKNDRLHSLHDFIVSSLQREMESIASSVQAEAEAPAVREQEGGSSARRGKGRALEPRVSGLGRLDDHRRGLIDRTGVFESRDLAQGEARNAPSILRIIDESLKLSAEAAKQDQRRQERERFIHDQGIERGIREARGAPPSYDDGSSVWGSLGTQGDRWELSTTSKASDVKNSMMPSTLPWEGTHVSTPATQAESGPGNSLNDPLSAHLPTSQLPQRPSRSRSARRRWWHCFGTPDEYDRQ